MEILNEVPHVGDGLTIKLKRPLVTRERRSIDESGVDVGRDERDDRQIDDAAFQIPPAQDHDVENQKHDRDDGGQTPSQHRGDADIVACLQFCGMLVNGIRQQPEAGAARNNNGQDQTDARRPQAFLFVHGLSPQSPLATRTNRRGSRNGGVKP